MSNDSSDQKWADGPSSPPFERREGGTMYLRVPWSVFSVVAVPLVGSTLFLGASILQQDINADDVRSLQSWRDNTVEKLGRMQAQIEVIKATNKEILRRLALLERATWPMPDQSTQEMNTSDRE